VFVGCGVIYGKSRDPEAKVISFSVGFADFMDEVWKCIVIHRKVVK